MTPEFLAKIIRFVRQRRDKFVIVNPNEEGAIVVMPFSEYEEMAKSTLNLNTLTERSQIDKINREITTVVQNQEIPLKSEKSQEDWEENEALEERGDHYYMEPLE